MPKAQVSSIGIVSAATPYTPIRKSYRLARLRRRSSPHPSASGTNPDGSGTLGPSLEGLGAYPVSAAFQELDRSVAADDGAAS